MILTLDQAHELNQIMNDQGKYLPWLERAIYQAIIEDEDVDYEPEPQELLFLADEVLPQHLEILVQDEYQNFLISEEIADNDYKTYQREVYGV